MDEFTYQGEDPSTMADEGTLIEMEARVAEEAEEEVLDADN